MEKFAYTNRDYKSIKDALIARAKLNPDWTDFSENDIGMVLIELFAGMGDMLSYTIDRVANECFLPTAVERQSILNMAKLTGYTPHGARAAKTMVCLKWEGVTKDIQLPLFLTFVGSEEKMVFQFDPYFWLLPENLDQEMLQFLLPDEEQNKEEKKIVPTLQFSPKLDLEATEQKVSETKGTSSVPEKQVPGEQSLGGGEERVAVPLRKGRNVFEFVVATPQNSWYTIHLDQVFHLMKNPQESSNSAPKKEKEELLDLCVYQIRPVKTESSFKFQITPIIFPRKAKNPKSGNEAKNSKSGNVIELKEGNLDYNPILHETLRFHLDEAKPSLFLIQYLASAKQHKMASTYFWGKEGLILYSSDVENIKYVQIQYCEREKKQKICTGKIAVNAQGGKISYRTAEGEIVWEGEIKQNGKLWRIPLPKGFFASRLGVAITKKDKNGNETTEYPTVQSVLDLPSDKYKLIVNKKEIAFKDNEPIKTQVTPKEQEIFLSEAYYKPVSIEVKEVKKSPISTTALYTETKDGKYCYKTIIDLSQLTSAYANEHKEQISIIPPHEIIKKEIDDTSLILEIGISDDFSILTTLLIGNLASTAVDTTPPKSIPVVVRVPSLEEVPVSYEIQDYVKVNDKLEDIISVETQRIKKDIEPAYTQQFPWPTGEHVHTIPFTEFPSLPEKGTYRTKEKEEDFLKISLNKENQKIQDKDGKSISFSNGIPPLKDTSQNTLLSLDISEDQSSKPSLEIYLPVVQGMRKKLEAKVEKKLSIIPSLDNKIAEDGFLCLGIDKKEYQKLARQQSFWECLPNEYHYYGEWEEWGVSIQFPVRFPCSETLIFYRECQCQKGNVGANTIQVFYKTSLDPKPDVMNPISATGGDDEESVEDMRENIPKAVARRNRLVTLADYEAFLKSFSEIEHFQIVPAPIGAQELAIYVAPAHRKYLDGLFRQELKEQIQQQKMLTTRVDLCDPQYVDIFLSFILHFRENVVDKERIKKILQKEIADNINHLPFDSVVDAGEIYKTVLVHPEIRYITDTKIVRGYIIHGRLIWTGIERSNSDFQGVKVVLYAKEKDNKKEKIEEKTDQEKFDKPLQKFIPDAVPGCFTLILFHCASLTPEKEKEITKKPYLIWEIEGNQNIQPYFLDIDQLPFTLCGEKEKSNDGWLTLKQLQVQGTSGGLKLERTELPRIKDFINQIDIIDFKEQ